MGTRNGSALLALAAGLVLATTPNASAQATGSDSVVKAEVKAEKPGNDGKQVLSVTLDIDSRYHLYANPVGNEDLASNQTTLTVAGKNRLESVKVDYPEGKVKEDKILGNYRIYKGKVTIKATVQRAAGDTGPLQVAVKVQACSDKACLLPATLKLSVP